jgi:lambda repressor-like predicted transcriptional regulator
MITTPKRIRIEMIKKDITGAEIARRVGVDRTAIYKCMDGLIKSYRLRKAIADALGVRVEELWPENNRKKAA